MRNFVITLIATSFLASPALAEKPAYANHTAQEIIDMKLSPEATGLKIAEEADHRDFGFGDMEVGLDMVLRNAQGDETKKHQRNLTFEMKDTSVGDKTMIIFDRPRDVAGTAFLTHSKILEPDDQWLYLPSLKRVKRIASKNKSGPFVGSEFAYEDISSQEVGKYGYKYLRSEACPTDAKLQCFVVERTPKYEYSGYTKQISWADHDHFRLLKVDFYDRKDELLKTLTYEGYKQYLNQYWRPYAMKMKNHQTGKSTDLFWNDYRFRVGLKEDDFTKDNLKRMK